MTDSIQSSLIYHHISIIETKYIQSVIGTFLYYTRALDCTMLLALNQMYTQQAQPTQNNMKTVQRLLDYANTYSNTALRK